MVWAPSVWQARWLPPSGDCGSVASCHLTMAHRAQGRRPENRPGGDDSDPGLASRRDCVPTATHVQKRYSRISVGCTNTLRREGTREPQRRDAIGRCGLSRQPQIWYVWTVAYVRLFEPVEGNFIKSFDSADSPSLQRFLGEISVNGGMSWGTGRQAQSTA